MITYPSYLKVGRSTNTIYTCVYQNRAFTLIELLVAISIIGILSTVVLASVSNARESAKQKSALQFSAQNDRIMGADAIGMWNFEEGSGTNVGDVSGWGNHGTVSGAIFTTDTYNVGVSKQALTFDGVNDYVSMNIPDLSGSGDVTVSVWVKIFSFSGSSSSRPFVSDWNTWSPGSQKGFILRTYSDQTVPSFWIADGTNYTAVYATKQITLNKWCHVVGTFKAGSVFNIYMDGMRVGSGTPLTQYVRETSTPVYIGRGGINAGYFHGTIDDVRIYARSLTAQEVKEQYLAGIEKFYVQGEIDESEYRGFLAAVQ